jgi:hypothetical protein
MKRCILCLVLLALVAAVPASAAPILSGTDLWVTPADGKTFTDFAATPIPSGFFCNRSEAFTGRIAFKGAPLASDDPAMLRTSDTIIHRMDDAVFDAKGVAVTRVQVRALNLVSLQPVHTACGDYNVRASLAGDQPVTRMRIYRESETGGRYAAPLGLVVKLTFTPVAGGRALSLTQGVRFPANPNSPWVESRQEKSARFVRVDTNGDGRPDTLLPGSSNFRPLGTSLGDKLFAQDCLEQEAIIQESTVKSADKSVSCQQAHTTPGHAHYVAPPPPPPTCNTRIYEQQLCPEPY